MGQEDQILDMNKSLGKMSIHESILDDIRSKKYNLCAEGEDTGYTKCNLFVDDMLKKYHGVSLPKRKEFKGSWSTLTTHPGWEDNPMSAAVQDIFFRKVSKIPNVGITAVDPMTGSKLSAEGKPVIVLGAGHATLASPHSKWPQVYRSDLTHRVDERMEVGLKPDAGLNFYAIDPKKYKEFRELTKGFSAEDIMYQDEKVMKILQRLGEE